MKIRDIFITANSNLLRSKLRSSLTIVAIFIGSLTLTLTNGIGAGIAEYIEKQLGNVGAKDMFIIQAKRNDPFNSDEGPQKYDAGQSTSNAGGIPLTLLTNEDIEKIKSLDGIKSARLDLNVAPDYIVGVNGEKYRFNVSPYYDGVNISVASGKIPDNQSSINEVLVTPEYPAALGFESKETAVGKIIKIGIKTPSGQIKEVEAFIAGVQEQTIMSIGGSLLNSPLVSSLHEIQTENLPAASKEPQPIATARFDTNLDEKQVAELKKQLLELGYVATTIDDQIGILKQVIDAIIVVLNFFAGIALLAASFGIINTLLMAVQERTKEIGLMKAMGMNSKKIFLLFSIEAMLLGLWGSLLGVLAGIGIGKVANKIASETFLKDLIGFELTSFPLTALLTIISIIMLIAFLAGTLPARRASGKDPIEALRYD